MGTIFSILGVVLGVVIGLGVVLLVMRMLGGGYRIPLQGTALVCTGMGGMRVSASSGIYVWPIVNKLEHLDVSVKRIEIHRHGSTGLICADNLRADIKVTFFVRVDTTSADHVIQVAQSLGCERASDPTVLAELFEPKFSDALKAAGRKFEFEKLFDDRAGFRKAILDQVGKDLNGYVLDDAAIDLLEQTPVTALDPQNVLDAQGIRLIAERVKDQHIKENSAKWEEEQEKNMKTVDAKRIILDQNKTLAEAEEKQKREISSIKAKEESETLVYQQQMREKAEKARIATEQEILISEQHKEREIIVAQRLKERTDAIESVKVEKDRQVEDIERDRVVSIKEIEKTKMVEEEKKNIQETIKARVILENDVVAEEQRMKDTEAFATASREKKVAVTNAEAEAERELVKSIKGAEAAKRAAELKAEQDMIVVTKGAEAEKVAAELHAKKEVIEADAEQSASIKIAEGKKALAEATSAEYAAAGIAEARAQEAKAISFEKQGTAEARVLEAKAAATEKQGTAEAKVLQLKFEADADGILKKADAMKRFHDAGKDHEEFKLKLNVNKEIAIAEIDAQKDIASSQAMVVSEALKSAKIDIVGGETQFFDKIIGAVTAGKAVDRTVDNSGTLRSMRDTFFSADPEYFRSQIKKFASQFGVSSADLRDLTIAAAVGQLMKSAKDSESRAGLKDLLAQARHAAVDHESVSEGVGGAV